MPFFFTFHPLESEFWLEERDEQDDTETEEKGVCDQSVSRLNAVC